MTNTIEFLQDATKEINPENIEAEMRKLPSQMAYANSQYADAHRRYLVAEMEYKQFWATTYLTIEATQAKATVKAVEAAIRKSVEYHEAKMRVIEAEAHREKLKGFSMALAGKKEMLVSIGMRINAELRFDPLAAAQAGAGRGGR